MYRDMSFFLDTTRRRRREVKNWCIFLFAVRLFLKHSSRFSLQKIGLEPLMYVSERFECDRIRCSRSYEIPVVPRLIPRNRNHYLREKDEKVSRPCVSFETRFFHKLTDFLMENAKSNHISAAMPRKQFWKILLFLFRHSHTKHEKSLMLYRTKGGRSSSHQLLKFWSSLPSLILINSIFRPQTKLFLMLILLPTRFTRVPVLLRTSVHYAHCVYLPSPVWVSSPNLKSIIFRFEFSTQCHYENGVNKVKTLTVFFANSHVCLCSYKRRVIYSNFRTIVEMWYLRATRKRFYSFDVKGTSIYGIETMSYNANRLYH